ncbi:FecR family protein [Carboxylicivirga sp. A043]|uniref:FecR family protein n=1 Tax=Carboxylicivirga litoralis TaxID=2816963 RepID=UPI0021CB5022|nr:FecR domain-containing protein [Carboxylicivirga sp. A043]MCU4154658.1 FecR family protein [Carboxylicivirga sp. A043]
MERIIIKYLQGTASKDEQNALLEYLRKDESNQKFFQQQKDKWKAEGNKMISLSTWKAWQKVNKRVDSTPGKNNAWLKVALSIASVLIVGLLVSTYIFINKSENIITVQTKHGQNSEIILPDSSIVHLNANSSISYNALLFSLNRTVNMTGEAFFDVRKQSSKKFILNINNLNVTVLGTRFNVNAYETKQSIDVVLEEGSVVLTMDDAPSFRKMLQPGEKASINIQNRNFVLSQVDTKNYSSWKDGVLYFKNNSLSDFFAALEKRYGVDFILENNDILHNMNISLTIDNDHLNDIIEVVQLTLPITIKTEKNTFKVKLDKKRYSLISQKQ